MNQSENSFAERTSRDYNKVETIRQLAKRHMMDQFHTTTDEEIKNAVVEIIPEVFVEYKEAASNR